MPDTVPPAAEEMQTLRGAQLWNLIRQNAGEDITPSGSVLHQAQSSVFQSIDQTAMTATFVILTDEQNRHGNSHQITSGKLGQGLRTDLGYEKNPIVLYSHGMGMSLPIGLSATPEGKLTIKKSAKQATATVYFPQRLKEVWPQGIADADDFLRNVAAVFSAVDAGMLRMSSIGFNPILAMLREQDAEQALPKGVEKLKQWRGLHFTETEMLEWSITPIGVDRGALRQAAEAGKINGTPMPSWMVQSFEQAAGPKVVSSPGMTFPVDEFRQAMTAIGTEIVSVVKDRLDQLLPQQRPAPPAPVAETHQSTLDGAQAHATIAATIAPQQMADAYRAQGQGDVTQQIVAAVAAQAGEVVKQAMEPLAKDVAAVTSELRRRTGKLP